MELEKVLHMKGGTEATSYAQTAYITKGVIQNTKPIREEAIAELHEITKNSILCLADLGCAAGPNTFTVVSDAIIGSEKIRQKLKLPAELDYQVYLNDLPGNDFNSLFMCLPKFRDQLKKQAAEEGLAGLGQCFVTAVPGSFYGRLFPSQSLHFVHSSYSLHWLSQVPKGLEDNKQNIYMSKTSPSHVLKAYKEQFQKDTALFLRSRSKELVKGGRMVLTYWGRSLEDPTSTESCFIWEFFANVFDQLIYEGIIAKEKLETFNIPVYQASLAEVIEEVEKEGSFSINATDVSQMNCDRDPQITNKKSSNKNTSSEKGDLSKLLRSALEPLLASHFGQEVIDDIFQRLTRISRDAMAKQSFFVTSVTISVTKT